MTQHAVQERTDAQTTTTADKTTQHKDKLVGTVQLFEGGASRSEKLRYDLVPPEAVDAIARRITLGASIHGERNWEKGGPAFYQATLGHLMDHLLREMQGDTSDEHLDAIICNAAFLVTLKRRGRSTKS